MSQDDALQRLTENRTLIVGQWFNNTPINLDGYHFQRCRFDNCIISSGRGDFQLTDCYIDETTKVFISRNSAKPIRLLMHRLQTIGQALEDLPGFQVKKNPDGTISI